MPSVNDAAKAALNVTGGVAKNVVALTDKGPLGGFKKFISRGSSAWSWAPPSPPWSTPSWTT